MGKGLDGPLDVGYGMVRTLYVTYKNRHRRQSVSLSLPL
jgi:hypothetical protein